ncbi:MAG: DUF2950 family protein [Candidatus Sulfotelmatobacter sp.]
MESNAKKKNNWKHIARVAAVALAVVAITIVQLKTRNTALTKDAQPKFQSPAAAGSALALAAGNSDEPTLAKILGVDTKALLTTGDKEADTAALKAFASKYEKMNRWVDMTDGSRVLYIGADNFAFPVPLAKDSSGHWHFDAVAGAQEIRARDIGRNELLTIDACSAVADAQEMYYADSGYASFAQRIIGSPDKQDGLYWPASDKQDVSPLATLNQLPKSSLSSLSPDQPLVLDGYSLRILTEQGDDAPGGSRNYIVNGRMAGGYAILATPVRYAETGIMTFMTGVDGVVYERDLGPDTAKIAASIHEFNPTDDWSPVE